MINFVALATAIGERERTDNTAPPRLAAFAMLHAQRDDAANWTFSLIFGVATVFTGKVAALTTLADRLPWPCVLIGRSPYATIYEPLLRAAEVLPEPLNFHVTARLARAFGGVVVDLDAYQQPKRRSMGSRKPDVVRNAMHCDVIDYWFAFLRRACGSHAEAAKAATNAWLISEGSR